MSELVANWSAALAPGVNRRAALVSAAGLLGWVGPVSLAWASGIRQVALVIGNDQYQHNARLQNAVRDAELVGQTLKGLGADVVQMKNATAAQMRDQVLAVAKRASSSGALVWLYYSGHGVQIDGKNYLQGVDADFSLPAQVRAQGLDLTWVTEMVTRDRLPAAVVLVDACRDNPFLPSTRGLDGYGLAPMEPQGVLVGFSTAPFKKALDGQGSRNGPYAQALASVFSKRPLALEEAMRQVANKVYQDTGKRQAPWLSSSLRGTVVLDVTGVRITSSQEGSIKPVAGPNNAPTRGAVTYRPDITPAERPTQTADYWQRYADRLYEEIYYAEPRDAKQWIQQARKSGASDEVKLLAGYVLLEGRAGQDVDLDRSVQLLLPMARKGNVLAQTLLGEAYFDLKQPDQAYRWLTLASDAGFRRASTRLAAATFMSDWRKQGTVNVDALRGIGNSATSGLQDILKQQQELMKRNKP